MARSYSDPSYGSRKNINLGGTGSVIGTSASGTGTFCNYAGPAH